VGSGRILAGKSLDDKKLEIKQNRPKFVLWPVPELSLVGNHPNHMLAFPNARRTVDVWLRSSDHKNGPLCGIKKPVKCERMLKVMTKRKEEHIWQRS
jgi:hypothetical protein